jgi:hypothetical protein
MKDKSKPVKWEELLDLTAPAPATSPHAFVQQQMRKKKSARKVATSAPKKKKEG